MTQLLNFTNMHSGKASPSAVKRLFNYAVFPAKILYWLPTLSASANMRTIYSSENRFLFTRISSFYLEGF
jgi:hypothetical protein